MSNLIVYYVFVCDLILLEADPELFEVRGNFFIDFKGVLAQTLILKHWID